MQGGSQFQDRFSQYLAARLGNSKAEDIIYNNSKSGIKTPARPSFQYSKNSDSPTNSIDSSALSLYSHSNTKSHLTRTVNNSNGKTVSVKKKLGTKNK